MRLAGPLYIVDTSVHRGGVGRHPDVRRILDGLIAEGAAATCVTLDLEAGFSGRTPQEVRGTAEYRQEHYINLPVTEVAARRARDVQLRLAERSQHRAAGAFDLLTAAIAEERGATVLHYDSDFDHIAAVTGQPTRWILPRGSAN